MITHNICFWRNKKYHYITRTCLFKYILKFLPPKNENFQIKNSDNFHISAQNIDCGTP